MNQELDGFLKAFGASDCREGSRSIGHSGIDTGDWEDYAEVPIAALEQIRAALTAEKVAAEPVTEKHDWVLSDIARQHARNSDEGHDYLPYDKQTERLFTPHRWVKDAMKSAIAWDRRMNRGIADPQPVQPIQPATLSVEQRKRIARIVHTDCTLIPGATFYNAAEMAINATLAQITAQLAVPGGWKALPPELTHEMRGAMARAAREYMQQNDGGNSPDVIYEAAFATAPAQPCGDAEQADEAIPEDCDVRKILLRVVPGDGSGHEVYARNVAEVVELLSEVWERLETLELSRASVPQADEAVRAQTGKVAELEQQIADLKAAAEQKEAKSKEFATMLANVMHDQTVAMQAALIEWKFGKGVEAGFGWIINTLDGPGLLPDFDAEHGKNAQFWFDTNRAEPFPKCFCGNPSHQLWMGQGFCCNEHYAEAKAKHDAARAKDSK